MWRPSAASRSKKSGVNTVSSSKKLKVTLLKSIAGRLEAHRACVRGLGLRRQRHSVELPDGPEVRGMIAKVAYLLDVKEV